MSLALADSLAEEKYKDGDVICAQGEEGDFFYIIKDGTAVCSQVDSEGNQRVVATLTRYDYLHLIRCVLIHAFDYVYLITDYCI